MNLASMLSPKVAKVSLEGITKEEVIAELAELLVRAGLVKDRTALLDALMEREAKGSTGIGGGIAIPHARVAELNTIVLAVGISRDGVEFDAVDDKPVHLVFLLMGSISRPGQNVEALADIGCLVQVPGLYQKLVNAPDAQALIDAIATSQQSSEI